MGGVTAFTKKQFKGNRGLKIETLFEEFQNFETKTSTVIAMSTGAGVPRMMTFRTELEHFIS